jgi:hypothetical protein
MCFDRSPRSTPVLRQHGSIASVKVAGLRYAPFRGHDAAAATLLEPSRRHSARTSWIAELPNSQSKPRKCAAAKGVHARSGSAARLNGCLCPDHPLPQRQRQRQAGRARSRLREPLPLLLINRIPRVGAETTVQRGSVTADLPVRQTALLASANLPEMGIDRPRARESIPARMTDFAIKPPLE